MEKKRYLLLYRTSVGLLMGSVSIRFLLGYFRNVWMSHHFQADGAGLTYINRSKDGPTAVYVRCDENGCAVAQNCTDLFLQLTWIEIVRKIMAWLAAAGMAAYGVTRIVGIIKKWDEPN